MAAQTDDKKLNGAGLATLWGIIKQFFSSKQDKVSTLGSATKPVYISGDGTFSECDSYKDSTAKNIVGEFSDTGAEFAFRPSAGAVDIESGKADFGGHLETIKGNTVVWNQSIKNADFSEGTTHWEAGRCTMSISGNIATLTPSELYSYIGQNVNVVAGHKYYVSCYFKGSGIYLQQLPPQSDWIIIIPSSTSVDNFKKSSTIYQPTYSGKCYTLIQTSYYEEGYSWQIKGFQIVDLTLIYGSGNEPTTVAAFEADYQKWFGKPLSYEAFDAGSLRPVKMTGIKTVGFNLWDEEWESGAIDNTNGDYIVTNDWSRSANFIAVIPDKNYYLSVEGIDTSNHIYYFFYNSNKQFLRGSYSTSSLLIKTPENCRYIKIQYRRTISEIKNYKVNINLHHSGDKDGEYEPYWSSTLNVPVTSLKGKLNGAGSSVVVFPDGMKKAGSVYDEIVKRGSQTIGIKRIGAVDLGTQTWHQNEDKDFRTYLNDIKSIGSIDEERLNLVCPNYPPIKSNIIAFTYDSAPDKTMCVWTNKEIFIKDTSYSDSATFKTAMNGVILYYELETPEEYVLDDFELPQSYDVDDWGTEEILLGENGCAPILDLKYGINAGDTIKNLPHSYVSAVGEQNFTEAQRARARQNIGAASQADIVRVQKQIEAMSKATQSDLWVDMGLPSGILWAKRNIDLSQANGFAASEYQYEGSFFSWGNTDGHNPVSDSSFGEYSFGTGNDTEPYVSSDGAALTGDTTPSFDAARVNLGTPWRMPTSDDFAELFNSAYTKFIDASGNDIDSATTNKLITMNGVVGIRLKSIVNGNIIFFPCSGGGDGSSLNSRGSNGYYCSASLNSATNGRSLSFHAGGVYPQDDYYRRYLGFAVRPVM